MNELMNECIGIGEKRATKLLQAYESLDDIIAAAQYATHLTLYDDIDWLMHVHQWYE